MTCYADFLDFRSGLACALLTIGLWVKSQRAKARYLPLPPGPKKLPLLGNLLDLPTSEEWVTYHKWCKDLGTDMIHLEAAGMSIIVLDTAEAAVDLLDKRSAIYSSRVVPIMAGELMGASYNTGMVPYGEAWRQHRKYLQRHLNASASVRFRPHEVKGAHHLLRKLLSDPVNFMDHFRHFNGGTIMKITYGINIEEKNDPYVADAETGLRLIVEAIMPGAYWVDILPFLRYVPKWFPGASFKRKAEEWRKYPESMRNKPFEEAKKMMANGHATESLASLALQDSKGDPADEGIVKDVAGSMYSAGSDTGTSAMFSCILALLENPAILRKAQQQIDQVIGKDRLPTFEDYDSLPYITAIAKESLRWRAIAPIESEDEYKGYRIPAKTLVIANIWAMLHDPAVYPDPYEFKPERFLKDGQIDPSVRDPAHAVFGFGRRICPGRFMAFESIWIALASTIAVFDFEKAVDERGDVIPLSHDYLFGLAVTPAAFKCLIKPRSSEALALIHSTALHSYE